MMESGKEAVWLWLPCFGGYRILLALFYGSLASLSANGLRDL